MGFGCYCVELGILSKLRSSRCNICKEVEKLMTIAKLMGKEDIFENRIRNSSSTDEISNLFGELCNDILTHFSGLDQH